MPPKRVRRTDGAGPARKFYYQAISYTTPTELLVRAIPWVKVPVLPPNFVVIELHNGTPTPYQCHASRGTLKMSPDRVCWVNKDTQDHVIQFLNGQWPFLPSQNPGNEQILVPALGASGW